jgi:hypothetical protein
MLANKAVQFKDMEVGVEVYNPSDDSKRAITELLICEDNTLIVVVEGKLYGGHHRFYLNKEDYLSTVANFKKAKVIGEAFVWGDLPPNITEEQLNLILNIVENKT